MSSGRAYAITVVGGIAAGGTAFLAASRVWSAVAVRTSGMPTDRVAVDGTQAAPLVGALALVVMAGSVAVLATSGRLRTAVGAVIIVAAATAGAFTVGAAGAIHDAIVGQVAVSPAMTGDHADQLRIASTADGTIWRWVALAALVVALIAGLAVLGFGRTWPAMGRRYDAPSARKATKDADPWKALDDGEDPTL